MVDLNNDGHKDILSGSYSRMGKDMAGLFQVLWGQKDGSFKKAEALKGVDGKPLLIPADRANLTKKICTRPTAVDWDSDGDLDLVVGNFEGTFYLFRGEGPDKFAPKPEPIYAGKQLLRISGAHSDPFMVDWDGDGDMDMLSGSSSGGVQWSENAAGKGKEPSLAQFKELIPAAGYGKAGEGADTGKDGPSAPSNSTRIWVDDVNEDGKLDLLLGDNATVSYRVDGLSDDEFEKKSKAWQEEMDSIMKAFQDSAKKNKGQADEEHMTKYMEHNRKRDEFMKEERTGFVWLYVQK